MIRQRAEGGNTFLAAALLLCGLALCEPGQARAQWVTSDNNIINTNAGNVGVGTTAPTEKLHVPARVRFGNLLVGESRPGGVEPSGETVESFGHLVLTSQPGYDIKFGHTGVPPLMTLSSAGHVGVGIGGAAPLARLHVRRDTPSTIFQNGADFQAFFQNLDLTTNNTVGFAFGGRRADGTSRLAGAVFSQMTSHADGSFASDLVFNVTGHGEMPLEGLRVKSSGNVGIGTASPAHKLDVQGGVVNASGGLCIAGDCKTSWSQVGGGGQWSTSGSTIYYGSGSVGIGTASLPAAPSRLTVFDTAQNAARITLSGQEFYAPSMSSAEGPALLVGVNRPGNRQLWIGDSAALAQNGTNAVLRLMVISGAVGIDAVGTDGLTPKPMAVGNGAGVTMSGNLGVGTSTPQAKLDVVQANAAAVRALSGSAAAHVNIQLGRAGAEGTLGVAAVSGNYALDAAAGDVILRTEDPARRLLLANGPGPSILAIAGGKVGIGKASPAEALDVVGNIKATGSVSATYQDVAEWVPSTQKLAAGTVVVLDAGRTNHVVASAAPYDTKVAGVVSAQPGVILGVAGEGKLKVATTGRVRVRVDATRAAIKVGDLLVTSGAEGMAMKSVPVDLGGVAIHRPGTIVGKALEPLDKGVGEILVLLSLQ